MPQSTRRPTTNEKLQHWRSHNNKLKASALSIEDYCRKEGLSAHTFRYWRTKLNKITKNPQSSFDEIKVGPSTKPSTERPMGHLPDPEWLAQFLKSLNGGRL